MSNTINMTIELGPESQAKLDKILEALQGLHPDCSRCVEDATTMVIDAMKSEDTAEETAEAPATVEPETRETDHPVGEVSPHGDPVPAAESEPVEDPEEPKYTKDDVLALVQKLAAPNNPKREQAKAIVKRYATKISDIPVDKYGEVMDKLTALDMEG